MFADVMQRPRSEVHEQRGFAEDVSENGDGNHRAGKPKRS